MENKLPSIYPLIQAPMAGAQNSEMAIAVCRAGALGSLPAAMLSPQQLATEIKTIQAATAAPFNVNFFAHTLPEITETQRQRWHRLLQPYLQRYHINPDNIATGTLRRPFDAAQLEVIQQLRPAVVSFHFGLPEKALLMAVKNSGTLILSSATTIAEGIWLEQHGADMVIAQGAEAGGHRGQFLDEPLACQMGTFALTARLAKYLSIPVIAAGGIAGVEGIQAVLRLGAAAVQLGTAYLLCSESRISPAHRQAVMAAQQHPGQHPTAITNLFSGKPARGLVNDFMREQHFLSHDALPFPYAASAIGALRKAAEPQGDNRFTSLWCGENPDGCASVSATALTQQLIRAFAAATE